MSLEQADGRQRTFIFKRPQEKNGSEIQRLVIIKLM